MNEPFRIDTAIPSQIVWVGWSGGKGKGNVEGYMHVRVRVP